MTRPGADTSSSPIEVWQRSWSCIYLIPRGRRRRAKPSYAISESDVIVIIIVFRWVVIAIPAATMIMIIIHRLYAMSNVFLMDAASGMLSAELIIGLYSP